MWKPYTIVNRAVTALSSQNEVFLVETGKKNTNLLLPWIYRLFTIVHEV